MKTLTLILLCLALAAQGQNSPTRVWTGYGEDYGDSYGAGITGGDFNNDGFSDVLLGAFGWNNGQGKDYLYLGSPAFFDSASFTFVGNSDSLDDAFDLDISNVQDVNGDSIADFLIPAYYCETGGYVEIFFGGVALDTIEDWLVKKQAQFYLETFGYSTDSTGDVNGDGWSDFIICGGDPDADSSYMEIYFGGPDLDTIPDWHYATTQFVQYPFQVNGLGDVNGDGYDDILAYKPVTSAPYFPGLLFFGGSPMDTIPDMEFLPGMIAGGAIGDVNGDGYCDMVASTGGPSHVYFGSANMDTIPDVAIFGLNGQPIGITTISAGDINGDGISDILCSVQGYAGIYLGSPWFNGALDWWYSEFWMYDGFNIGGVGDVNGDACDDFVLGLRYYQSPFNRGKAYLYAGNPNMVDNGAGVAPEELPRHPGWFKLHQNFPNPFNSSTSIHFEIGKPSVVNAAIYDLQGNTINQLIKDQSLLPGGYNVSWAGKNSANQPVGSGIYILELQVDQYRQMKKMVLIR